MLSFMIWKYASSLEFCGCVEGKAYFSYRKRSMPASSMSSISRGVHVRYFGRIGHFSYSARSSSRNRLIACLLCASDLMGKGRRRPCKAQGLLKGLSLLGAFGGLKREGIHGGGDVVGVVGNLLSSTSAKFGKGGKGAVSLLRRNLRTFLGAFGGFDSEGGPSFFGVEVASGAGNMTVSFVQD